MKREREREREFSTEGGRERSSGIEGMDSQTRKYKLRSHIEALNAQFAEWVRQERASNSCGIWTAACKDYINYVTDLEKEFAENQTNAVSFGSTGSTTFSQLFMFGTGDCGQLGFGEDVPEMPFPKQLSWNSTISVSSPSELGNDKKHNFFHRGGRQRPTVLGWQSFERQF